MNGNSIPRRPAGPVRQHSLQQPPRRQQSQTIRRQRSTEDEKTLQSMYSTSPSSSSRNRFTNNANKFHHHHHHHHHHHTSQADRPKVRVAWSEQPSNKSKTDQQGGVEIVARQIPTGKSSRPATGRNYRRCPLAEKATILYSRQELAERLRLAWRQREENKSNIDIFLAHNTVEDPRCDSRMSTATTVSTPQSVHKKGETDVDDELDEECGHTRSQNWFSSFNLSGSNKIVVDVEKENKIQDSDDEKTEEDKENIETSLESSYDEDGEETMTATSVVIEKKSSISINCNDWNTSVTIKNKNDIEPDVSKASTPAKQPDYSQARLKRASYQSGTNKAFTTPVTTEKSSTPRITSRTNSISSNTSQETTTTIQPRFRRTSSAPPLRRTQVNIVIDAPSIAQPIDQPQQQPVEQPQAPRRVMSAKEQPTNKPIKSTPSVKKRTKPGKRRSGSLKDAGAEDEDGKMSVKGSTKVSNGKNATLEAKSCTSEVVTMVSLISSADSESEMDENSPRDDKLISELRNKLPTTPIIKSSNGLSGSMRKPFKSVSFQQDSFDYDLSVTPSRPDSSASLTRETSSLQARFIALSKLNSTTSDNTATMNAATISMTTWRPELPILQQQQQQQQTCEIPLTDREKRCLAVPIGDIHDKKRKLVRCRSAVSAPGSTDVEKQSSDSSRTCLQTEMRVSQIAAQMSISIKETNNPSKIITIPLMPTPEGNSDKDKSLPPTEPYCQTPKEKECWHLYKKMCDKGVFVSFDTVLRGMLTPTEYRLRQKEMSQNC